MKIFLSIVFSIFLLVSINKAQTIYVADSATEDNEPINAKNNWEIDPWGKTLHVILDNEREPIEGNIVYLFIDKYVNGKYTPFDSKSVNVQQNSRRISYEYDFREAGKYHLYYINISQQQLASIIITISDKSRLAPKAMKRSNYYDNVKLQFCKKVLVGGTPMGVTRKASLSENHGEIYIKLTNFSPLKTEVILVDFWRKEHRSFEYDEYVASKKYTVDPEWKDTYFKYRFPKSGEYKIVIYNQAEVLISTGYIKVSN